LTLAAQNVVTTAVATVVTVNSGLSGFQVQGVTQDLAKRLYLAASNQQEILLAQDVMQAPVTYAGIPGNPGYKNGAPLASQFHGPSFLAFDQAQGTLYVSDAANNVIRRVNPGTPGTVDTLAGTGTAGSQDGPVNQASFNNPQGIALDGRGYLWVADSGNQTIRRINLQTGTVQTIAGTPGAAGLADGQGAAARFHSPIGLAVETETAIEELQRELQGQPPPPVQVLIADSGNNVIRRVTDNGQVDTIGAINVFGSFRKSTVRAAVIPASPLLFNVPTGIAVDALHDIYVTESASHQLKTLLSTGKVVPGAQPNTLQNPGGIAVTAAGGVVVADGSRTATEIRYGQPQITSVVPSQISIFGGESVTVSGGNFAPDTVVVLGGVIIPNVTVSNTQTLMFTAPAALPSGLTTLTIQNRGGLAQTSMLVKAVPLSALAAGQITTAAGGSTFAGDGSLATAAVITSPAGVAVDSSGNLYIADAGNHRIRKVDAVTGVITTVAGTGRSGFSGDGGIATAAQLSYPWGVAVNTTGDLLITDNQNHRIRRIDANTGIITTVAGTGQPGFSGEGGLASSAMLSSPFGIAVDPVGNLIIADTGNYRIRKVDAKTGIITTVAGTGTSGFSGDNGPATAASFAFPFQITLDAAGNIFVSDTFNQRIRKISAGNGTISTIAGSGQSDFSGDGGLATAAALSNPVGVAVDAKGNVFIADQSNNRIRQVAADTKIISTIAGTQKAGFSGDGGLSTAAQLVLPNSVLVDASGNLLVGDAGNHRVRTISAASQTITTTVGTGQQAVTGDNGPATAAALGFPSALTFSASGDLIIADTTNQRVRRVSAATGTITSIAGTGQAQFSGDSGPAVEATLSFPQGVALDSQGNVFIADSGNNRIRKIQAATGIITTIAGGDEGFAGDNGPAAISRLSSPKGIAVDAAGNLLIADSQNNRIRRIDAATGVITTVAGNGQQALSGDNGPATAASLAFPTAVAIDSAGNLFIADNANSVIRKVAATTGIITTVVGDGRFNFAGDGGQALAADLNQPYGLALAADGTIFIADQFNRRIRKVDAQSTTITTIAGNGQPGISGDGGPALNASFDRPLAVAIDNAGNVFIADAPNNRVRAVRAPAR
jgi:sugar lactone lactonase YvrE